MCNWFTIHGIEFEFRAPFPSAEKYKPLFTICGNIFVDVLEVSKNGKSFLGREYLRDAKWRRHLHEKCGTKYIELPTWRFGDLSVYDFLAEKLKAFGLPVRRLNELEITALIVEQNAEELMSCFDFLHAFLSLHKNSELKLSTIRHEFETSKESYLRERSLKFLRIYTSYYLAYQEHLDDVRGYDFADMINIATRNVNELAGCAKGYRYILLDEVQDLSRNRQELVLAILKKNPDCKLFAVGDDWQSIYRFTGSNLALIRNFDKVFQRPVRRSLIESTHRFANPTLKISGEFVQKNPLQAHKKVRNHAKTQTPIKIVFNEPNDKVRNSDVPAFERAIESLISELGFAQLKQKRLQIISRYNHDIARLGSASNIKINGTQVV